MKHSVTLDVKRCRGCTTCIKSCPTEAIRVRRGKALILADRCIDCGTCIRVCPHSAIKPIPDQLEMLEQFEYRVAVPSPALYGQFQNLNDVDVVLNGLLEIGFQDVYEVAKAAEYLSDMARQKILAKALKVTPRISSACPTVLRLICMRFPKLIGNIMPAMTPVELAAILARKQAAAKTGLAPEKIGVFSIVPCPSQVTAAHNPVTLSQPVLDGAFSIRDIYLKLLSPMKKLKELKPMASAGIMGVGWAFCGGESAARLDQRYLAVDGIENVIRMLEEIEDGRLPEADFIELNACVEGCVGGCMTVENPFGAHMRIKKLMKGLPVSRNRFADLDESPEIVHSDKKLEYIPALLLDTDRAAAMEKMIKIEELEGHLPGLHCGSCGAPSCHAFAEDVVMGRASQEDCIFRMRERMQYMTGGGDADEYLPAPFRRQQKPERGAAPKNISRR
jgi:Na+-translocating ferredoxin:NAD+ oxidoreductase RNF subunit RnfB